MGSIYLADILRIHASRLRNLYVMNVKISEIYKLTSKFHHKSLFYAVHSQNMFKNCWIFESGFSGSGFFPEKNSGGAWGRSNS